MEILQQRQYAAQVYRIIDNAKTEDYELFISLGAFYTITYLTERYLKADQSLSKDERLSRLRYILNGVLGTFKLAPQLLTSVHDGVNDLLFEDLEDSYQAHVAEDMGCDVLLTINEKHFARFNQHSSMIVLTPQAFIDTYM
jgi:hypothetical protein